VNIRHFKKQKCLKEFNDLGNHPEMEWNGGGFMVVLSGISWKLNENIWNTPFHSFKILRRRFKGWGVCASPMWNQQESRWEEEEICCCAILDLCESFGTWWKHLEGPCPQLKSSGN